MSTAAGDRPATDNEWDDHAGWWIREFTDGADVEYSEQLIPLVVDFLGEVGDDLVVDVGAGDGQMTATCSNVVAVDRTWAHVRHGDTRRPGLFLQGDATALPIRDRCAAAVVVCLVFEHVAQTATAIREIGRVLRPGGSAIVVLNHPLTQTPDSGWVDDHTVDPPEVYWRLGSYLDHAVTSEEVMAGVWVTFHHRPLGWYVERFAENGMLLDRLVEPRPADGFLDGTNYPDTIPRLIGLRFRATAVA